MIENTPNLPRFEWVVVESNDTVLVSFYDSSRELQQFINLVTVPELNKCYWGGQNEIRDNILITRIKTKLAELLTQGIITEYLGYYTLNLERAFEYWRNYDHNNEL